MKKCISIALTVCMLLLSVPSVVFADDVQGLDIVYTGVNSGAQDGSIEKPYSSLSDAIDNVNAGGVVFIIGGTYSFINDIGDDKPFVIDKPITIKTAPNSSERGAISCRAAGILLEADVTFSNIDIGLASSYHNAICANGYALTLDNVGRYTGHKSLNIFAGGMADFYGGMYADMGDHASVSISGSSSEFDSIFAGGLNCGYDGDVAITIDGCSGMELGNSYSCGATEAFVDRNDWFNFSDPQLPTANVRYSTGNVVWNINEGRSRSVDGTGSSSTTVNYYVNSNARDSFVSFDGITKLCVMNGVLEPVSLNDNADIEIKNGATLDLQRLGDYTCNSLNSNGTIVLDTNSTLNVISEVNGSSELKTKNGNQTSSGVAIAGHTYVVAPCSNSDSFYFNPSANQSEYTLDFVNGEWVMNDNSVFRDDEIESIAFYDDSYAFTELEANLAANISMDIVCADDVDLSFVDFDYCVDINGDTYIASMDDGFAYIPQLDMEFYIYEDGTLEICSRNGELNAGSYELTVLYGSVSDSATIIITHQLENGVCTYCGWSAIDTSALLAVIEYFDCLDSNDYSLSSYNVLSQLVAEYSDFDYASQLEVDGAVKSILQAIYELEPYLNIRITSNQGSPNIRYNNESYDKSEHSILYGTSVTVYAPIIGGYSFNGWLDVDSMRVLSKDCEYSFAASTNLNLQAMYTPIDSSSLIFVNPSGQVVNIITKPSINWNSVTDIASIAPAVPYSLVGINGRWVYNNSEVLQSLKAGNDVTVTCTYDSIDIGSRVPINNSSEVPVAALDFSYDEQSGNGSFVMSASVPEDCRVNSIGIAFRYGDNSFVPSDMVLTLNNMSVVSQFDIGTIRDVYIVNAKTSNYNWAATGYITYFDINDKLVTYYTNQVNIVNNSLE